MTLIPFIDLLVTSNTGIAFSLFSSSDQTIKIILIMVTFLALLFLGNEFRNAQSSTYKYALILIISGGFGNFFERIIRGAVTDFLHLRIEKFSFFVFNLADLFITLGAVVIFIQWIRLRKIK
tara:strand:+ start:3081 stop:3446 length:366 start_codon:yes stop_codon:yes gene_type:complete